MDIILKELLLINGKKAMASFSASGMLTWNGDTSGGLQLQNNVLAIIKESWSIRMQFLQFKDGGCCKSAQRVITEILMSFDQQESVNLWYNTMQDFLGSSGRPKRLLVLINPFSGKGLAPGVYKEVVKPLFEAAGVTVTLRETQFQRHAKDMAKTVDISQYDGIICVSGDGVLVEVLNGLLERDDWEKAIQMPIGIIPAGSGNGVAKSLLAAAGEACNALNATFAIIKGQKQSLDVATVVQGNARFHSILLLCWGYVSDVDIESEQFRWMGGFRFEFYSLLRIIRLRHYNGTIGYLPALGFEKTGSPYSGEFESFSSERSSMLLDTDRPWRTSGYSGPLGASSSMKDWRAMSGTFITVILQNIPWASEDFMAAPSAKFSDGYLDLIVLRNCSKPTLLKLVLDMQKGIHVQSKYVEYLKVKAFRLAPGGRTKGSVQGGYIDIDGEVVARGGGTKGDGGSDMMLYGPPIDVTIQQGLATMFSP